MEFLMYAFFVTAPLTLVTSSQLDASCCQTGMRYYKSNARTNGNARMCFDKANQTPRGGVCDSLSRICCLNMQQSTSCLVGIKAGGTFGTGCDKLSINVAFTSTALHCCECCQLGKQAANDNPKTDCKQTTLKDARCNQVFEICCKKTLRDDKKAKSCSELKCTHDCRMTSDGPSCSCKSGYILSTTDKVACLDVDECKTGAVTCLSGFQCQNLPGSYVCRKVYKKLDCRKGYEQVNDFCRDIDECATGEGTCEHETVCENILGGYQCAKKKNVLKCSRGFFEHNGNCIDENECKASNPCQPNEQCLNLVGSYKCLRNDGMNCPRGYKYDGSTCNDINECIEDKPCKGLGEKCKNILGSYQCSCNVGYRQDSYSKVCVDVDECKGKVRMCLHKCYNTIGGYQCACNTGFKLHSNKRSCSDVNECNTSPNPCGVNQRCVNTIGKYACISNICPRHYQSRGTGACVRACSLGENCKELPLLIRTFVRSKRRSQALYIPLSINVRSMRDVINVEWKFKKGNEKNYFTMKKQRGSNTRVLITASRKNLFNEMDPFAVTMVMVGTVNRRFSPLVKFEYHIMLNFY